MFSFQSINHASYKCLFLLCITFSVVGLQASKYDGYQYDPTKSIDGRIPKKLERRYKPYNPSTSNSSKIDDTENKEDYSDSNPRSSIHGTDTPFQKKDTYSIPNSSQVRFNGGSNETLNSDKPKNQSPLWGSNGFPNTKNRRGSSNQLHEYTEYGDISDWDNTSSVSNDKKKAKRKKWMVLSVVVVVSTLLCYILWKQFRKKKDQKASEKSMA